MRDTPSAKRRLAVAGITTVCVLAVAAPAAAQTGGSGPPGGTTTTTPTTPTDSGRADRPSRPGQAAQGRHRAWRPRTRPPASRRRSRPATRSTPTPITGAAATAASSTPATTARARSATCCTPPASWRARCPPVPWRPAGACPARVAGSPSTRTRATPTWWSPGCGSTPPRSARSLNQGSGPRWRYHQAQGARLHGQVLPRLLGTAAAASTRRERRRVCVWGGRLVARLTSTGEAVQSQRRSRDVQAQPQRLSNPSSRGGVTLGYTYGPTGARCTVRTSAPARSQRRRRR